MKPKYLVLADGTVFEGSAFGADTESVGELVFTTGMGGYIETLTDPSYAGQIVMQTFPQIGNYGIIPEDFEGKTAVLGYVVREFCRHPSNFRCSMNLDEWLKLEGIPGIWGIDTRAVTRLIREKGVMNAKLCDSIPEDYSHIVSYRVTDAVSRVTCRAEYTAEAENASKKAVLIDYGCKKNIINELTRRDCTVTVVPAGTSAEEILAKAPDGVMLSNGPGDPADNVYCIEQIKKLCGKVPIFGICLGHQLLALAKGAKTEKLKYGHRGVNQPVTDLAGGRTYITSQNHGYAVISDSIKGAGKVRFVNANDGTCEGIDYPDDGAFSVQFHPEARSGPQDTGFLFDRFTALMEEW